VGYRDTAFIYPRPIRTLTTRLASIWWAFCSPAVLGQQGVAACPNFFEPLSETIPLVTQQALSTNAPRLGLEEYRAYVNRKPGTGQTPDFVLHAVESGELDGVLYPKLVRMQQFRPDASVGAVAEVVCTKVERVEALSSYTPDLTGPVSVIDLRLPNLRAEYITTN
jgi:hypothetical protein